MQHEHTEHIAAPPDAVYAAISDIGNLPRFVPQLTGARHAEGDRVEVDARYHGHEQRSDRPAQAAAAAGANSRTARALWR